MCASYDCVCVSACGVRGRRTRTTAASDCSSSCGAPSEELSEGLLAAQVWYHLQSFIVLSVLRVDADLSSFHLVLDVTCVCVFFPLLRCCCTPTIVLSDERKSISEPDRLVIKDNILEAIIFQSSPLIRDHLLKVLSVVSKSDYPNVRQGDRFMPA